MSTPKGKPAPASAAESAVEPAAQSAAEPDPPQIWDAGLQPERTKLAWQRTLLATGLVSVVTLRIVGPTQEVLLGGFAVLATVIGWLVLRVHSRGHDIDIALSANQGLPGARTMIVTALLIAGLAGFAIAASIAELFF